MSTQVQLKNKTVQTVPFQPLDDTNDQYAGAEIITADDILEQARYIISARMERGPRFSNVDAAKEYLLIHCADHEREVFSVLFLDGHYKLIVHSEMFRGTVGKAVVHPREVVRDALMHNAAYVILCHNHTVDDPRPSRADKVLTQRVADALELVDIPLLDHLIVAKDSVYSFVYDGDAQ